ncbi:DUF998 domain-containing protein [Actinoplanes sp. NPDC026619]|uniref:DUF998 domain-containing protein n=1 Tax=Actinoplanes sp. NPDC026619 TaxID=3155798 RepID=UPI0033FA9849
MNDNIGRRAGTTLVAGGIIYLLAEFIAAAAWTDPPYSYTYHFISDLGVHGPSTGFGQYMYSPLAWVMNAGFLLFALAALVGVALLRDRVATALAVPLAAGMTLVALFPGSGEAIENGTAAYHGLGAFAAFICGNILVMRLGRRWLGIVGLAGVVAFMVDMSTGGILIGLIERGAVYPVVFGLISVGLARRRVRPATVAA